MIKLKTLILSGLAITALTTTSCIERKEDQTESEKPTTAAEIVDELNKVWDHTAENANPLLMKVGDFALFHNTQQIENQQARLFMQEGINLMKIDVVTDPDDATKDVHLYTFAYETAIYTGENAQQSTKEQLRGWRTDKPTLTTEEKIAKTLRLANPNELRAMADEVEMELGYEKIAYMPYMCVNSDELVAACRSQLGAETCSRSCTNLQVTDEVIDAPADMRAQPNCGGLPGCKIHQKRVKFNAALTIKYKNMTETQRLNYSFAVSPDLPYLARVPEFCVRGLIAVNSNKFLVTNCSKLANYRPAP